MPLSNTGLSVWYSQLSSLLAAGVPLPEAIRSARGPSLDQRERLAAQMEQSEELKGVLETGLPWVPAKDRPFWIAGALTGRLAEMLATLSIRRKRAAEAFARLVGSLIYPVFVIHAALVSGPVAQAIDFQKGGLSLTYEALALQISQPILYFWAGLSLILLLNAREFAPLQAFMALLPGVGGWLRSQALSDLAYALQAFLNAGVTADKAWSGAAKVCGHSSVRKAAESIAQAASEGESPGSLLNAFRIFPSRFSALYITGERTGYLEEKLEQAAVLSDTEAQASLGFALRLYPSLILGGIMIWVGSIIVSSFQSYVNNLLEMMK